MGASEQPVSIAGLILAGGQSRRMGEDKANLVYPPRTCPQWRRTASLLGACTSFVTISVREGQVLRGWQPGDPPLLPDGPRSEGPLSAMCAAARQLERPLLVVACDLPLLDSEVLDRLLEARGQAACIAFRSASDGLPEPLCALYEAAFFSFWHEALKDGCRCPRKVLIRNAAHVSLLDLPRAEALDNANTPEDYSRLSGLTGHTNP